MKCEEGHRISYKTRPTGWVLGLKSMLQIGLLLFLVLACSLEQQAGTEVGNPPMMQVLAKFSVSPTDSSWSIKHFRLRTQGLRYTTKLGKEGELWWTDEMFTLDLAAQNGFDSLPPVAVKSESWTSLEMMLMGTAEHAEPNWDSILIDSLNLESYLTGTLRSDSGSIDFAFLIPPEMKFKIIYTRDKLDAWHIGQQMNLQIIFDCQQWFHAVYFKKLDKRQDRTGKAFARITAYENSEFYEPLKDALGNSFNSSSMEWMP